MHGFKKCRERLEFGEETKGKFWGLGAGLGCKQ